MANTPDRISPLADLAMPNRPVDRQPRVELSERLCDSLVQVQAWPNTLAKVQKAISDVTGTRPAKGYATALKGPLSIMPSGPGRYLIEDETEDLEIRLRAAIGPQLGAVTGLTHGRVVVGIRGEKAAWVLATGIAINFEPSDFPVGDVRLTHHHDIGVTIHRTAEDAFDLYVFTSFARGFWHWISTAAEEVGYSVG